MTSGNRCLPSPFYKPKTYALLIALLSMVGSVFMFFESTSWFLKSLAVLDIFAAGMIFVSHWKKVWSFYLPFLIVNAVHICIAFLGALVMLIVVLFSGAATQKTYCDFFDSHTANLGHNVIGLIASSGVILDVHDSFRWEARCWVCLLATYAIIRCLFQKAADSSATQMKSKKMARYGKKESLLKEVDLAPSKAPKEINLTMV